MLSTVHNVDISQRLILHETATGTQSGVTCSHSTVCVVLEMMRQFSSKMQVNCLAQQNADKLPG